jgi:hypothetical protein
MPPRPGDRYPMGPDLVLLGVRLRRVGSPQSTMTSVPSSACSQAVRVIAPHRLVGDSSSWNGFLCTPTSGWHCPVHRDRVSRRRDDRRRFPTMRGGPVYSADLDASAGQSRFVRLHLRVVVLCSTVASSGTTRSTGLPASASRTTCLSLPPVEAIDASARHSPGHPPQIVASRPQLRP